MNQQISQLVGVFVRHGLGLLAGGAITSGMVTSSQVEVAAGAITALVIVAWSVWQKRKSLPAG